jgi:hypothetical protein
MDRTEQMAKYVRWPLDHYLQASEKEKAVVHFIRDREELLKIPNMEERILALNEQSDNFDSTIDIYTLREREEPEPAKRKRVQSVQPVQRGQR